MDTNSREAWLVRYAWTSLVPFAFGDKALGFSSLQGPGSVGEASHGLLMFCSDIQGEGRECILGLLQLKMTLCQSVMVVGGRF